MWVFYSELWYVGLSKTMILIIKICLLCTVSKISFSPVFILKTFPLSGSDVVFFMFNRIMSSSSFQVHIIRAVFLFG